MVGVAVDSTEMVESEAVSGTNIKEDDVGLLIIAAGERKVFVDRSLTAILECLRVVLPEDTDTDLDDDARKAAECISLLMDYRCVE